MLKYTAIVETYALTFSNSSRVGLRSSISNEINL